MEKERKSQKHYGSVERADPAEDAARAGMQVKDPCSTSSNKILS